MAERESISLAIDAGPLQTKAAQMDFIDFSDFNTWDIPITVLLYWHSFAGNSQSELQENYSCGSPATVMNLPDSDT